MIAEISQFVRQKLFRGRPTQIYPTTSWRIGLWLFLIWPPALAFAAFLAGEQPWHWYEVPISLGQYATMMIAACVGGWLGALLARRYKKKPSNESSPA